ncbi:MAG: hypothetical protein A2Z32_00915 [Chloroflexi bacterium RBG_16_69_14]|nr:MAG: hypothetical protein A2Z32_00915 [Chloroflexi bacterium RBG_16_69_14]
MNRRALTIFSAVVVGAMLLLSAWAWFQLPADARVPIHWGPDGQVDGYADKTIGLLLLPLTTLGVAALLWVIPVIEPRRANFEKSGKAYGAIWVAVVLMLAAIDVVAVAAALGGTGPTVSADACSWSRGSSSSSSACSGPHRRSCSSSSSEGSS